MSDRLVVYAIAKEILPGPYAAEPPEDYDERLRFYDTAPFASPLSKHEAEHILYHRVVLHGTYSLQQGDFHRMGFEVSERPWKVMPPEGTLVVCIGTKDRYDIFGTPVDVCQYETVEQWRSERDANAEGWS